MENDIISELINSMDNLNKSAPIYQECYMTFTKFCKLFPHMYEFVYYSYPNWYFKGTGIKIKFVNCGVVDDVVFTKKGFDLWNQ